MVHYPCSFFYLTSSFVSTSTTPLGIYVYVSLDESKSNDYDYTGIEGSKGITWAIPIGTKQA